MKDVTEEEVRELINYQEQFKRRGTNRVFPKKRIVITMRHEAKKATMTLYLNQNDRDTMHTLESLGWEKQ